ncbi:MAG: insulinase family protein, partial [Firmicutes bacterium]|nr:insulinase family protein [Bacillota bacterium]
MASIRTLSNGVKVVLEEIPYVRSVSFGIWVNNGSVNEDKALNGVSHYIEHMMFKGTKNRSARQIAEEMDEVGGQINAYTTKEYTCYHTRTLDKHFDIALSVLSDMFLNSRFDENDIKRERNVIVEEINMYDDAPEELVHDIMQAEVWKNDSIGMPILGTVDTISTFDSEKIKAYFKNHYRNDNTVISVVGYFNEDEMLEKLEKAFGGWVTEKREDTIKLPVEYHTCVKAVEKDTEQLHICLAFPSGERDHPKKYAYAVFNAIFGGGMSSMLFQKVREDNGLTYSIYSYLSAYKDCGLFMIYAVMNPNQTETVLK